MNRSIARTCRVLLFAGLGSVAAAQQLQPRLAPANQPFIAMHTFTVQPTEEEQFLAAIKEINAATVRAGCPSCVYHEFKISGEQVGPYNYMQVSYWPNQETYAKVHRSTDYVAVSRRLSDIIGLVYRGQTYNRYVEVNP